MEQSQAQGLAPVEDTTVDDDGWATVWPPWIRPGTMVAYRGPLVPVLTSLGGRVYTHDMGVVREVEADGAWVWSINGNGKVFTLREDIAEHYYVTPPFDPREKCGDYRADDREGRRGCRTCGCDEPAHRAAVTKGQ